MKKRLKVQDRINNRFKMYLALAADVSRNARGFNQSHPAHKVIGEALVIYDALAQPMLSELYLSRKDYTRTTVSEICKRHREFCNANIAAIIDRRTDILESILDKYVVKPQMMAYLMFKQSFQEIWDNFERVQGQEMKEGGAEHE